MTDTPTRARSGKYGVDAPTVPIVFTAVGIVALAIAIWQFADGRVFGLVMILIAAWFLLQAASFLYTTLAGKFACWDDLLDGFGLRGEETCIDLGCGRGMVVVAAAKRLPAGSLVGVDLWRSVDQSGNAIEAAQANLAAEDVADRVTLETADITALTHPDDSFDLVLSALVIHNIKDKAARAAAVREAFRVLRPGGVLAIADFQKTDEYQETLAELGAADVTKSGLGWRYWYGGPWAATSIVTATKPNHGA